jgi:16S rRNA pseudouridine516 synthase
MRLDKYLSDMGLGTRSVLKQAIRKGNVTVNGVCVRDPGCAVSQNDSVIYCGRPVRYETFVYYMMNKPAGVITATQDRKQKTVLDLIGETTRKDLFPVGRLDRDTEGLLLITNDGGLAHRLLSPSRHVDKVYRALIAGIVTEEDVRLFAQGLEIDEGFTAMPAGLQILSRCMEKNESEIEVTIREGKYHQVKRTFLAVGKEVRTLKRLSMGPLVLDPALAPGAYRRLTEAEQKLLFTT